MVVHFRGAQSRAVRHTVTGHLTQVRTVTAGAAITRTWTAAQAGEAALLLDQLTLDWRQGELDTRRLYRLEQLSAALDLTACTLLRAQLEAIRHCLATSLSDVVTELTCPAGA